MIRDTHDSPFYIRVIDGIDFAGLQPYKPRRKKTTPVTTWGDRAPSSAFQISMNGRTVLGFPLYRDVLDSIGIADPTHTQWVMGYNDVEHVRLYFFCPAKGQSFAPDIPRPYPLGLEEQLKSYALGYPIEPLAPGDYPSDSCTLHLDSLYLFPHLQPTNVRRKGSTRSFAIGIPGVFLQPEIGRVFRHAKGDPWDVTWTRKGDVAIHLEPDRIPYTLLYDTNGNLFYFRHFIYGGSAHVPSIPGVRCS